MQKGKNISTKEDTLNGGVNVEGRKIPGPALISLAIMAWALILWVFTLGHPSFVPVARLIFIVFVIPIAVVEWLKMKGILKDKAILPVRLGIIILAAVIWYTQKMF